MNELFYVEYFTGVKKQCGYRQELVTAIAEKTSEKTCVILVAKMEKAISNRQSYDNVWWSQGEKGKKKRLSSLRKIVEISDNLIAECGGSPSIILTELTS